MGKVFRLGTAIVAVIILAGSGGRAEEKRSENDPDKPKKQIQYAEQHGYLAPGLQFGNHSQEISLTFGASIIQENEKTEDYHTHGGGFFGWGLRAALVAEDWKPTATHGLFVLSFGGWGWEWWPFGFEIGIGGGGYRGNGYGLLQLSYIAGITGRIELFGTVQQPVAMEQKPAWFSDWLIGLRYGFDLAPVRRTKITTEPVEDRKP